MMLLKKGYSTGAIINAPALAPELGVDRGFEYYSTTPRWNRRVADETTRDALKWIDENSDDPFFIFVHYFDPHLDYEPPSPYNTAFNPDYDGAIEGAFTRETYYKMQEMLSREDDPQARKEWGHIIDLYDGEILFTDRAVGDLLKGIDERGLRDNMLIVFMSDHGEEFFDHKGFEHGHTLYDELIKVPLMFSLPGRLPEGKRIGQQVRILDVLPTVLEILDIRPWTHLEGASLMPLMAGEGSVESGGASLLPSRFAYSESMLYGTEKKSITAFPWKFVYDTVTEEEQLFDLAGDPGEQTNAVAIHQDTGELMREVLLKTVLTIDETWYVEAAGGNTDHIFDITITVPDRPINGNIKMYHFMDSEGHLIDEERLPLTEASNDIIRLEGLELGGTLTLAFKAGPKMVPVKFDLRIDGESAQSATYLGEKLVRPEGIPFREVGGRFKPTEGAPGERPEPPYIVVWHTGRRFEAGVQVELGDDTKRQLKALGYIQ
jgi:hypothetical protein